MSERLDGFEPDPTFGPETLPGFRPWRPPGAIHRTVLRSQKPETVEQPEEHQKLEEGVDNVIASEAQAVEEDSINALRSRQLDEACEDIILGSIPDRDDKEDYFYESLDNDEIRF